MLIVALGDSLTAGFPLEPFSWTEFLRELPAEIINAGINGDTLDGMAARLERYVLEDRPDLCFFMGGSNDAFLGRDQSDMQRDATEIQSRLHAAGITRTVAGVPLPTRFPELEERLEPFRRWVRENLENPLDFRAAFGDNGEIEELLPDGVHPSREAYERMGRIALKFFRDRFKDFD